MSSSFVVFVVVVLLVVGFTVLLGLPEVVPCVPVVSVEPLVLLSVPEVVLLASVVEVVADVSLPGVELSGVEGPAGLLLQAGKTNNNSARPREIAARETRFARLEVIILFLISVKFVSYVNGLYCQPIVVKIAKNL